MITASAIALSAALLTAVVNFVASGNAMLAGFLGEDYGLYGSAYFMLLLVPRRVFGSADRGDVSHRYFQCLSHECERADGTVWHAEMCRRDKETDL